MERSVIPAAAYPFNALIFARRGSLVVGAALLLLPRSSRAQSTEACMNAFHRGQDERAALALQAARASFSTCSQTTCPSQLRADCAEALAALVPDVPTLVPAARHADGTDIRDLTVYVDGQRTPVAVGGSFEVDPGAREIRFESPGLRPRSVRLVVRVGEHNRPVPLTLEPTDGAPPPPAPTKAATSPWVLPLAAGGVAALGSFAYFGASGLAARSDALDRCAPACASIDEARVRQRFIVADVSLAVGVVALAAATVVYFATRSASDR